MLDYFDYEMENKKIKKFLFIILILILLLVGCFTCYHITLQILYPTKYAEYVYIYSEKYDIEPAWIFAIIKAESNFNKDIVSRKWGNRSYANYGRNCKGNFTKFGNERYRLKKSQV